MLYAPRLKTQIVSCRTLIYVTNGSCDAVIFMLMMLVRRDELTFGVTLFVPETDLSIDRQEDKRRDLHLSLEFHAASSSLCIRNRALLLMRM